MRGKLIAYRIGKAIGLFSLARVLTRRKLRILAYHGVELRDESRFIPSMFIRAETFAARLELLRRKYPVLPLAEAVRRVKDGTLPPCAVAITIDDGFHSTGAIAVRLLRSAGLPAMLYVTTYYTQRDVPVFRLAMQYCFWKTDSGSLDIASLGTGVQGTAPLGTNAEKFEIAWELINYGERDLDEEGRTALLNTTAAALGVDLGPLLRDRFLHLMTPEELRLADSVVDVQLHTHRHRLPDQLLQVRAEIEDNRAALAPLVHRPLVHFCYPSGFWSEAFFPALAAAGIETATTCEGGFNGADVHPYALKRFIDGEHITPLEFEAELSGLPELLRVVARWLGRARRRIHIDEADRRRGYSAGHGRTILERGVPGVSAIR